MSRIREYFAFTLRLEDFEEFLGGIPDRASRYEGELRNFAWPGPAKTVVHRSCQYAFPAQAWAERKAHPALGTLLAH